MGIECSSELLDAQVVVFADTHGAVADELGVLDELLGVVEPSMVLYERLEGQRLESASARARVLAAAPSDQFSVVSRYADLQGVVRVADEHGLPVIGCDLPGLGRDEPLPDNPSRADREESRRIVDRRERHQARVVRQEAQRGRVVLVVGAGHVRPDSTLLALLADGWTVLRPMVDGQPLVPGVDHGDVSWIGVRVGDCKKNI